jgi:hypothetical protein
MNIPLRADGTIDNHCEVLLADFAAWMKVNGEAIFETRPFVIYGEGPTPLPNNGMNELKAPMTAQDIRFTTKGDTLYAIMCGWPASGQAVIKTLAKDAACVSGEITGLELLGCREQLKWSRTGEGLVITLPSQKPCQHAFVFKITGLKGNPSVVSTPATVIIRPDRENTLRLTAEDAVLHGERIRVQYTGNVVCLSSWDYPKEYATWDRVQFTRAGTYEVSVEVAIRDLPSDLMIEIAGQRLIRKLSITGQWDNYVRVSFGNVEIKESGTLQVTARPGGTVDWHSVNMGPITIKPASVSPSQGSAQKFEPS